MINSEEIRKLIEVLRPNGDQILEGKKKFSVTPNILNEINIIRQGVKEELFYVFRTSNEPKTQKYSKSSDAVFLYELVKNVPKLRVSDLTGSDLIVDVTDFANLKYLELYKVNIQNVKGIQRLRDNIEMIVCSRCINNVADILLNIDFSDENCDGFIWSKLRHVILSQNNLTRLDDSFIHTPWLQYVDVSYNQLNDLRPLASLRNLMFLNASFNKLESVPNFSEFSSSKLKVVLLRNNLISDISGLRALENLRELDLSCNFILEKRSLQVLFYLRSLQSLNLNGNPISHHAKHRLRVCNYLHVNTNYHDFQLDGEKLSKVERDIFLNKLMFFDIWTSSSQSSDSTTQRQSSISNTEAILDNVSTPVTTPSSSGMKSGKKAREAYIAEGSEDTESLLALSLPKDTSVLSDKEHGANKSLNNSEYLETKKQIEALRKQYGKDDWLHSKAGSYVNDILGLHATTSSQDIDLKCPNPTPISASFNSKTELDIAKIISDLKLQCMGEASEGYLQSAEKNNLDESLEESGEYKLSSNAIQSMSSSDSEDEFQDSREEDDEESFAENEVELWVVQKIIGNDTHDMILILTDKELKEINISNGRAATKYSLDMVMGCVLLHKNPTTVELTLDKGHGRKYEEHRYVMEYPEAQKLIAEVRKYLESKPLSAFDQIVFQCIKCGSLFCKETGTRKSASFSKSTTTNYCCINCGSHAVVIADEPVLPSTEDKTMDVTQSPSLSSIDSEASLDQNKGSKDQESDIEVISNPSQSSVEVLDAKPGRPVNTSAKSKSFNAKVKQLNGNGINVNQFLTESSSSGSMTDSVCTIYDTRNKAQQKLDENSVEKASTEEKSSEKQVADENHVNADVKTDSKPKSENPADLYDSLLDDLLHSVSSKIKSRMLESESEKSSPGLNYSFTDFFSIDHRFKFYFYNKIFQENEHLVFFIRVEIIIKMGTAQRYTGAIALSTNKVYFFKINKEVNSFDASEILQLSECYAVEKLRFIQPLLWYQGFCMQIDERTSITGSNTYIMLLMDDDRTNNFVKFCADLEKISIENQEMQRKDFFIQEFLMDKEDIRCFLVSEIITVTKDHAENIRTYPLGNFAVTESELLILSGNVDWLLPSSNDKPKMELSQKISDLINVTVSDDSVALHFLNEVEGHNEFWDISVVSERSARQIIDAIRTPWESVFHVPLQVNAQ